jgi:hypothetical protein
LNRLGRWPDGRVLVRPGVFFGEYVDVAVYGARSS